MKITCDELGPVAEIHNNKCGNVTVTRIECAEDAVIITERFELDGEACVDVSISHLEEFLSLVREHRAKQSGTPS